MHDDQLLWDFEARENARRRTTRSAVSQGTFSAKRKKALADPKAHPLRRTRLTFGRGGLTIDELSERSTVAESVIRSIEANDAPASDQTWIRLSRALGVRRDVIDPRHVYVPAA